MGFITYKLNHFVTKNTFYLSKITMKKPSKEKPLTRLTMDSETHEFHVVDLHSPDLNVKNGPDLIEDLALKGNMGMMTPYVSNSIPRDKINCLERLSSELQNIKIEQNYDDERAKRFQILKMILGEQSLVKRITASSTQIAGVFNEGGPVIAWNEHPIWKNYNFTITEKYNSSFVDFARFFRNHEVHHYQAPRNFQLKFIGSQRIDNFRYCKFINANFPCLLNFLITMYLAACDDKDEMRRTFPHYDEKSDLLFLDDLEIFLSDTIKANFRSFDAKFLKYLDQFLKRNIVFDKDGNFLHLRNANKD